MITIVLIDDHKVVRQGVKGLLDMELEFKVIGDAADGPEGLKLVDKLKPDILITDIKMGEMDGLEVVREAKNISPVTKTIVLSMYSEGYVTKALQNGARGYVTKGSGISEVVQAVREVASGGTYVSLGLDRNNSSPAISD